MFLPKLNPIEPPWYGPVCPVVGEGRRREASPYPDQSSMGAAVAAKAISPIKHRASFETPALPAPQRLPRYELTP